MPISIAYLTLYISRYKLCVRVYVFVLQWQTVNKLLYTLPDVTAKSRSQSSRRETIVHRVISIYVAFFQTVLLVNPCPRIFFTLNMCKWLISLFLFFFWWFLFFFTELSWFSPLRTNIYSNCQFHSYFDIFKCIVEYNT